MPAVSRVTHLLAFVLPAVECFPADLHALQLLAFSFLFRANHLDLCPSTETFCGRSFLTGFALSRVTDILALMRAVFPKQPTADLATAVGFQEAIWLRVPDLATVAGVVYPRNHVDKVTMRAVKAALGVLLAFVIVQGAFVHVFL